MRCQSCRVLPSRSGFTDAHRANIVQHFVFSHTHVVVAEGETLRRYCRNSEKTTSKITYVTKRYLDYIQNYHSPTACRIMRRRSGIA